MLEGAVEVAHRLEGHRQVVEHPRQVGVELMGALEAEQRLAPQAALRHVDAESDLLLGGDPADPGLRLLGRCGRRRGKRDQEQRENG